jgi:outer membrane protein OmpA-like peptidoglycan-associated protein
MRKIWVIVLSMVMLLSVGLSVVSAVEVEKQNIADTPSKYGFKGLYTLFDPNTYQQGQFGIGVYWDMTRFCLPGDPRYPEVMEVTLGGAYGITDKLEVGVAVPFRSIKIPKRPLESRLATDEGTTEISESGLSNVSVGVRYALLKGENFALTPYIQAFLPTAQDPEKGTGADNTRIHFGVSAGTLVGSTKVYLQAAYQYASNYDQDRRDFTETTPYIPSSQPRFSQFGTNPLFQEYGNTIFYGAGLSIPLLKGEDGGLLANLFSEFTFYHSLEDNNYIPMFEDGKELDTVKDGGMANVGMKLGFGNGLALTAGWGGELFGEEPRYDNATWRAFAGLTYNKPAAVEVTPPPPVKTPEKPEQVKPSEGAYKPPPKEVPCFDCSQAALANLLFEFDKSTLPAEEVAKLKQIGRLMRVCKNLVLEVQGHTDWVGTENYNMGLGNRRARAAVYYLVYDEGIDPARIVKPDKLAKGIIAGETYGESQPIASNETDAGRAQNRRAQFVKLVDDKQVLCKK